MKSKSITHIAPDIGYLFPETAFTAKTLCGKLIKKEVLDVGEFIGVPHNLNTQQCEVCPMCAVIHVSQSLEA